jgi:hypothetical protein
MCPRSSRRFHNAWVAARWRGSVVRMKSSLVNFIALARSRKFRDTASVNACGSTPAAAADFSTF